MAHKTKKKYEDFLNEHGAVLEDLMYLTEPAPGRKVLKKNSLRNLLNDGRYGYIMRKYDPIAFETGYELWSSDDNG